MVVQRRPKMKINFDPHFPYELVNRSSFVDLIAARAAAYRREYDAVPEFRAGIHGGPVVVAQCGDFNQEIVYFGDTVNTAARVQQRCKDVGRPPSAASVGRLGSADDLA